MFINWLKNKTINTKLHLMIVISLISLMLLGAVSNYLINSTKVVSIMLVAQRDYMMAYHDSFELYYQSLAIPEQR